VAVLKYLGRRWSDNRVSDPIEEPRREGEAEEPVVYSHGHRGSVDSTTDTDQELKDALKAFQSQYKRSAEGA